MKVRYVPLADADDDEAVVVIDVLRAFTVAPWLLHRGVRRLLAVDTPERARQLRAERLPDALLAGESGGAPLPGFDLGNSPTEVAASTLPLHGAEVVHRTSAGTQGLVRCADAQRMWAASFATAAATARALRQAAPARVTFVVTGASHDRDGDEDLAAAELIAARAVGDDPDPTPFLARVATSDAGRNFRPGGPSWATPADLAAACELDRFDQPVAAREAADLDDGSGRPPVVELASG